VIWLSEPKQGAVLAGLRFIAPSPETSTRLAQLLSALQPL
jgi:hypothetical protein